jgi:hypothetical protein
VLAWTEWHLCEDHADFGCRDSASNGQYCSFVAPWRRPILIATPLHQSLTWCTNAKS